MRKYVLVLIVTLLVSSIVSINADNISFSWTPTVGQDTLTVSRYVSDRNAIKNVVNGSLTNTNLKATAAIANSKIDSTSGWLYRIKRRFTDASQVLGLHSFYGMSLFINDSTTYSGNFKFISDSTDTLMILATDSLSLKKPIKDISVRTFGLTGMKTYTGMSPAATISPACSYIILNMADASDSLKTIAPNAYSDGDIITLINISEAVYSVTIHDGDGNILCGTNVDLNGYDVATLIWNSALAKWLMISYHDN